MILLLINNKKRIIGIIALVFLLLLLSSCNNRRSSDSTIISEYEGNDSLVNSEIANDLTNVETSKVGNDYDSIQNSEMTNEHDRVKNFLDGFSHDYTNFEILDYVAASHENYPMVVVAIAENKEDASSSTLFVVDDNGVGQVVLASDIFATYRKEDGLVLHDNVIQVSLDLKVTDINYEIHDFEITVTQREDQGVLGMVYSSKQVIRTK